MCASGSHSDKILIKETYWRSPARDEKLTALLAVLSLLLSRRFSIPSPKKARTFAPVDNSPSFLEERAGSLLTVPLIYLGIIKKLPLEIEISGKRSEGKRKIQVHGTESILTHGESPGNTISRRYRAGIAPCASHPVLQAAGLPRGGGCFFDKQRHPSRTSRRKVVAPDKVSGRALSAAGILPRHRRRKSSG